MVFRNPVSQEAGLSPLKNERAPILGSLLEPTRAIVTASCTNLGFVQSVRCARTLVVTSRQSTREDGQAQG